MKVLFPQGVQVRKTYGTNLAQLGANARVAAGMRVKIEALCYACNHDWLGPKEQAIKPKLMTLMAGLHGPLPMSDQRDLAFWAIKTVMTAQLSYPAAERGVPRDQYRELHRGKDHPPPGVHVLIGHSPERVPGNLFGIQPIAVVVHPTSGGIPTQNYRAYQATMIINRLVVKVIGHNGPPAAVSLRHIFPNLAALAQLTEIWPPSSLWVQT
jgi:hypothetical protein